MVKLFTHTDLDGVGCAVVADSLVLGTVDVTYCDYDTVDGLIIDWINQMTDSIDTNTVDELDGILITDITPSTYVLESIEQQFPDVPKKLLDHHATAINQAKPFSWTFVQEKRDDGFPYCGTQLLASWLASVTMLDFPAAYDVDDLPQNEQQLLNNFVNCVWLWDTWEWSKNPQDSKSVAARQLNVLLGAYGQNNFRKYAVDNINDAQVTRWPMFLDYEASSYLKVYNMKKRMDLDNIQHEIYVGNLYASNTLYKMAVVFFVPKEYISELGNMICAHDNQIDFVLMINFNEATKGSVSLRCVKDNINVGNIAKEQFHGGGHPKSAGGYITYEEFIKFSIDSNLRKQEISR